MFDIFDKKILNSFLLNLEKLKINFKFFLKKFKFSSLLPKIFKKNILTPYILENSFLEDLNSTRVLLKKKPFFQ
jgi:hypothetical protein